MPAPVAVFDLDGTLVDTAPDLLATLDVVLVAAGYEPLPEEKAFGTIGHGSKVMIEHALDLQNVEPTESLVKPMFEHFLAHYAENIVVGSRPFEGVTEALDRLAAEGAVLAVCTNKYEDLSVKLLDALGLSRRFAAIVGADTLGVRKPDPAHLLGTIERAGGDRARAVMVGDSRADIDAAKAAQVPVIAVDFGYTDTPVRQLGPDHVISHYTALYELAAPLLGLSRV
ncbi:phosphoglycolate phosphatase [Microbaculum sp. FT89]|uniref:phosphoglycolate phosphatase n=1 Tax=Microbaculum sp. FT89 TaxID=3447298 RepID=UPI003F536F27